MKELTIEQKARAYDEALERAMKFLNKELFAENSECAIKHIFPELAESEDERIREYLIRYIDNTMKSSELKNKLLAWLEKQGKQKPQRMISAKAKEALLNESEREALRTECEKGRADAIAEIQKKWSEEDDKMCQETIDWFEKKCFPYAIGEENPARESIKWLKSLKQRIGE